MAIIANLSCPTDVDSVGNVSLRSAAYPVFPIAWGFMKLVEGVEEIPSRVSNYIGGALPGESQYLEPTIGQIWPR